MLRRFDKHGLDVKMQINDMLLAEYHTNNGFTKTTFKLSDIMKQINKNTSFIPDKFKNSEATWPVVFSYLVCNDNRGSPDIYGYYRKKRLASH